MDHKSLLIKNMIVFILGVILIGYQAYRDNNELYYLLIGGYILLSIYKAWLFGVKYYGNLFSVIMFWFLPFALVFAIIVSLIVGFLTSVPHLLYLVYSSRPKKMKTNVPSFKNQFKKRNNVIPFRSKARY
ncbi:hypothetical protein AWU65_02065 [Paenibacillus glucanolyticus]|uniref:Uncharacterized protein n=1 Tax=Paenibacillus glucanolyticus TaxID=59843 RepID=A0A163G8U6_9BACL|nr:hypothetical protein AWU65_02065 [Paenibacillus glucanolyticus]MDH6675731.1 type IV secretory pathway TrbL component [Paenibacillus sp. LBL]OMF64766.1 hypothetical protein BK142_31590 [Paenibacillus glucanolyticus]